MNATPAAYADQSGKPHVALVFKKLRASGGAEQMAGLLLEVFRSFDVRLSVLARDLDGTPEGFEFYPLNPRSLSRAGKANGFARAAESILEKLEPDLILSQEHVGGCNVYRAGGGVHAEWLRQRRRIQGPLARIWSRIDPHQRTKLELERATYESGALRAVICNSGMVRDDIQRQYAVSSERLHVIENAIDPEWYRPPENEAAVNGALRDEMGVPAEAMLWLFVGSGFERKGLGTAIQTLAHTSDHAHLAVVGHDRRFRHYQRMARRYGVADRVHFVGGQGDVRPYYWAADGLLHPALYEAYGLVVLEAMAAGLPVIASSQCGAANSLIRQGENGYLVDALDTEGWVRAMGHINAMSNRDQMAVAAVNAAAPYGLGRLREQVYWLCATLLAGE